MYTLGFLSQSYIRGEEGSWQMNFKYLWLADLLTLPHVLLICVNSV